MLHVPGRIGVQFWSAGQPSSGVPLQQQHSASVGGLRASRGEEATSAASARVKRVWICIVKCRICCGDGDGGESDLSFQSTGENNRFI